MLNEAILPMKSNEKHVDVNIIDFSLTDTISRMRQRLENEKRTLKEADDLFRKRNEECTVTEKYLNDMKFEMPQIKQRYNELKRYLYILKTFFFIHDLFTIIVLRFSAKIGLLDFLIGLAQGV